MKRRLIISALACTVAGAVIFSGCAGCAGCGGTSVNITPLSSNWYANTIYGGIQPTFVSGNDGFSAERITYDVKFDNSKAGNSTYKVSYANGTYTTEFYAAKFDKTLIDEAYRAGYPDDVTAYCYKTELNIPSVTFSYKDKSETFDETPHSVVTESWFLSVDSALRPLYSTQVIDCYSPAEFQVNSLSETYKHFSYEYSTSYNYGGSSAKTRVKNRLSGKDSTKTASKLNEGDNVLFDVGAFNIGVRAMKLTGSLSQAVNVYSPAGNKQTYTLRTVDSSLSDAEKTSFATILEGKNLYESGEDKELKTVAVGAVLSAQLQGVSQTYYFAAVNDIKNNTGRATMVKMTVPANYSLGTFTYSLKSIENTLWND